MCYQVHGFKSRCLHIPKTLHRYHLLLHRGHFKVSSQQLRSKSWNGFVPPGCSRAWKYVCMPTFVEVVGTDISEISSETVCGGTRALLQTRAHLNSHQAERFLIFHQSFKISFSALASFLLPSHKHTYYIYSGSSFIMSFTLRKKCQHKYEYFWKQNMTVSPQKAPEDCRDVSKDAVKLIDFRVKSP